MADISQIGSNIRILREKRGLTQRALADDMLVSFQAISAWERGQSIPDLENVVRIADYFGVTVDSLLAQTGTSLFVGIDGGGTKTEFVLFELDGTVVRTVRQPGSNPNDRGLDQSIHVLSQGLEQLLQGVTPAAVFAGIGGGSSAACQEAIIGALTERFHTRIAVDSDAANVLSMGADPNHSAAVICGTGSCVFVRKDGQRHRFGGWGYLFDQAGSAYDVGKDALRCTLAAEDGLAEPSLVTQRILDILGGQAFANISEVYKNGRPFIADLARYVLEAASAGDVQANEILRANARRLGLLIRTGISRHGAPPQIVGAGGFLKSDLFRSMVEQEAGVTLEMPDLPPVYGACIEALRMENIPVPQDFRKKFTTSYRRVTC